ncbi:hypothetical protein C8J56DRAFT_816427 [Mycena floridula]|nr:hypothetical protein C8J56DRAFT_816427 [Mycena floridula]
MHSSTFVFLALAIAASASPTRRADFALKNGQDAIALNNQFKTLTPDSPCTAPQDACVQDKFAQCVGGKFVLQACAATTICAALPLVNSAGTSITCTTPADLAARIAATGATDSSAGSTTAATDSTATTTSAAASPTTSAVDNGSGAGDSDPQTSLTLDPRVISKGFNNDGQDVPTAGQVASRTSVNNFINDCLNSPNLPLTNGQQITTGSCNNAPIGVIPSSDKMPSAKFAVPVNGDTIPANQAFTVTLNAKNIQLGNFVNAKENYFAAPQRVNDQGLIIGHTHIVIEQLSSLKQTDPTDPTKFAFFKGVDDAAVNGAVQVPVAAGVPAGPYRMCTINSSANHQPVIVPIAQHGSLDDCIYFTAE